MSEKSCALTGWQWWYGYKSSVDDDGLYVAEYSTKDAAISAALRDTFEGDEFYLIEAITGERADDEEEDSPFLFSHTRNRELWVNRRGVAEILGEQS